MESNIEEKEGEKNVKTNITPPVVLSKSTQTTPATKVSGVTKRPTPTAPAVTEKTAPKPETVKGSVFISVQTNKGKNLLTMPKKEFGKFMNDIKLDEFAKNETYLLECMQTDKDGKVKVEEKYNFQTDCKGKLVEGTLKKLSEPVVKPIREVVKRFQKSWACEQKRNTYIVDDACC